MKNKVLSLILIILLIIIMGSFLCYKKIEMNKIPEGYKQFAEGCKEDKCCMSSLKDIIAKNYTIIGTYKEVTANKSDINWSNICPSNLKPDMLLCETTYVWCEPNN